LPGEQDVSLVSTGPGLRWGLGEYASLRLDYGYQLREQIAGAGKDQQLHLGFTFSL